MKPKKLTLDRETLAPLTPDALVHVAGAQDAGCFPRPSEQIFGCATRDILRPCPDQMSRNVAGRCPGGPSPMSRMFHCPQGPFPGGTVAQ
jgi:hypothetical protein